MPLTPDNEKFLRKHYRTMAVAKLARRLNATPKEVSHFIDSIKTSGDKKRERIFRILMLAFPFLFVFLLEAGLRLGEYGGDTRLFREATYNGRQYYELNPLAPRRYFRNVQREGISSSDVFEKDKSPDTYRIFCLGESSTRGYPYMYNGAFPPMLKDRLQTLLPDKHIEVINLGLTAISSFVVLDFVKQAMEYKPDLLLVYTGHNEFYGAFAIGSSEYLGRNRAVINAYLYLERFKTFVLIRQCASWVMSLFGSSEVNHHVTMMELMVRDKQIQYGGPEYATALENFRANLEDIIHLAREGNTAVIIGTQASNLRGIPPFVSLFSPATPPERQQAFEKIYREADALIGRGSYGMALDTLRACMRVDTLPAKQYFLQGKCFEQAGEYDLARAAYRKARDYDGLPFRAPTSFNLMIENLCRKEQIPLAATEEQVAAQCAHGIIGPEMMLEHVHPNIDGYFQIAKAFFKSIADHQLIAPNKEWKWERDKSDSAYRGMVGVTAFDSLAAAARLFILTHSWPFTGNNCTVDDYIPRTILEKEVKKYISGEDTWEKGHVTVAEYYHSRREYAREADEYRALVKGMPYNISPYLRLAQTEIQLRDTIAAESTLTHSLAVAGTFAAYNLLGIVSYNLGKYDEAENYLQQALNQQGDDAGPELYARARAILRSARHWKEEREKESRKH